MSEKKKCALDNCMAIENNDNNEPVNCRVCKLSFHLSCLDIIESPKKIFVSKNIVFICNACLDSAQQSPKRKPTLVQSALNIAGGEFSLHKSVSSPSLTDKNRGRPSHNESFKQMNDVIKSLQSDISQNTLTLAELKDCINEINVDVKSNVTVVSSLESTVKKFEQKCATYASVVGKKQPQSSTSENVTSNITTTLPRGMSTTVPRGTSASTSAFSSKPKDVESLRVMDAETKSAIKGRKITAGKNTIIAHGLGSAVKPKTTSNKTPKPVKLVLPKSIYVSRLETTVRNENIIEYIKQQLPSVDVKHISAHIMAPKDANLEEFTFISFRLRCTDELFDTLTSPDFWPEHVFIGEFIEKSKERKLGDFIQSELNKQSASRGSITTSHEPQMPEQVGTTTNATKNGGTSSPTLDKTNVSIEMIDIDN